MKEKKFRSVEFDNKKKRLLVEYTSGKKFTLHYGQLGIKRSIQEAWVDRETGGQSIGFLFSDGKTDFMPYDQPLNIARDPDFLLQTDMELLVAKINEEIRKKKISKRFLAHQLSTSTNQIYRLLDPSLLNKNLEQLYRIAAALGLQFEIHLKNVA